MPGLVGALLLRARAPDRAARWNAAGLALATLYLGWSVAAQSHVEGVVHRTIAATPLASARALVTPAPFNTLLWRVVVMDDDGYHEGYYSLLDDRPTVQLVRHASETRLVESLREDWTVRRLAWFSKGFYAVRQAPDDTPVARGSASTLGQLLGLVEAAAATGLGGGRGAGAPIVMTDLRMGQEPNYTFSFVVARRAGDAIAPVAPQYVPVDRNARRTLQWIGRRLAGNRIAPPR